MYTVRGRCGLNATGAANDAIAQLWNDHSTQRVRVVSVSLFQTGTGAAGNGWRGRRSTARGTAGSTVTPDIDNHGERAAAPVSGVVLDLQDFSVQPTLDASEIGPVSILANAVSSGRTHVFPRRGLVVPPGTGFVLVQNDVQNFPASEIAFVFYEDA